MAVTLDESYAYCRAATHEAGSSFGAGMRLFPRAARDAVNALYYFFRVTDDIVDSEAAEQPAERLAEWREQVVKALGGASIEGDRGLLAVVDTAHRYQLPDELFLRCIEACSGDIGPVRVADFVALGTYCDGVAGTVGEACLRILGYHDDSVLDLSRSNARGVQVTNILRDVDEDLRRDRVYLPATLLAAHGLTAADLQANRRQPALRAALQELARAAEADYIRADALFFQLRPSDRPGVVAMTLKYRRLLGALRAADFPPGRMSSGGPLTVLVASQLSRWIPTWRG